MLRKILVAAATAALAKKAYDTYQEKKADGSKPSMDVGDAARTPARRSVKSGPLAPDDTLSPE